MDAAQLIEALGGTAAVAQANDVTPAAVRNWRSAGRFPTRAYFKMRELASANDLGRIEHLFWQEQANA